MTRSRLTPLGPLGALLAAGALAGCVSFGPKLPPSLLTLTATTPLAAGTSAITDDKRAVAVALPSAPQALMTQRVMVQASPTEIAYLKDAQWAAAPAQLFRGLLSETITVRTGRVVPDPRLLSAQPDTRLSGQLSRFGLDAPGQAVEVVFDAALTHEGVPTLQARRFAARVPVSAQTPAAVGQALDRAANDVAGQVADWVGR